MPTSLQDPERARLQRLQTLQHEEREWMPLWLAGPFLALTVIFGAIGLIYIAMRIVELVKG